MNNPSNPGTNPNTNPGKQRPSVDKTMVEGSKTSVPLSPLIAGTKVNVSSTMAGAANPYATRVGGPAQPSADGMPSGNESLPLGSGVIVGLLGSGGMARVYKIWNEKLEVFRAVKIVIPSAAGDLKNRFETEAKITAKLHHPNIVEVYNVGDFNGLPYLEMELIEGLSLEAVIAKYGKLPDPVCCAIALCVAQALAYAHSQEFLIYGKTYKGVIHRDLKPANIMLANSGQAKLMDFGIARPTETSLHTVDGNIVGTMQYLSPEQLDGVDIDNRTDLYSLGAILYEILTGTKTFPQDTITNLMRKKISNEYRKFNEFDFAVHPAMAKIAQKCLQLSKEQRYANAKELLKDLDAAYHSMTSQPPLEIIHGYLQDPVNVDFKAKKPMPAFLNKWVLIGAGVLVAVACLITVIILTGPKQAENEIAQAAPTPTPAPAPVAPAPIPAEELKPLNPATVEPPAPAPKPEPVVAKPKPTPKPVQPAKPSNPRDVLTAKYKTNDPMEIGKSAMSARAYGDAIIALENVPPGTANNTLRVVLLLEAYVESGKLNDAAALIAGSPVTDAQYDILAGRVYQAQGKNKKALDMYQSAITKPSMVRNVTQIRKDALYNTAVVRAEHFQISPTSETKASAIAAWNAVKKIYANDTGHARYKQADEELSKLQ